MVTALTSTVDGDEAPSTVDDGVALHGNLLNAPHNLFTASSSSRQQWWLKKKNLFTGEVSKNNTKMAKVRKKKKETV
ncbi:hypothetical protein HKD37_07G019587 [Glycine soja]